MILWGHCPHENLQPVTWTLHNNLVCAQWDNCRSKRLSRGGLLLLQASCMWAAVSVIPASFIKVFSPRGFTSRGDSLASRRNTREFSAYSVCSRDRLPRSLGSAREPLHFTSVRIHWWYTSVGDNGNSYTISASQRTFIICKVKKSRPSPLHQPRMRAHPCVYSVLREAIYCVTLV